MVEEVITALRRLALLLLASFALPSAAVAHQLDEYVQATLVIIEPGNIRLQINLTPAVAIADRVLPLIDRQRDGVISTNEANAYGELLKRDLVVRLDDRKLDLKLTASNFPALAELRTGDGIIQIEFSATPALLAPGSHKLTLQNRHLPKISAYLCNAARPKSPSVKITGQKRNKNQSDAEIDFTFESPTQQSRRDDIIVEDRAYKFSSAGGGMLCDAEH